MSVTVDFNWDNGDMSVNIPPGWGEDTVITVEMHGMMIVMGFTPNEDCAPEEWYIDQVDVTIPLFGPNRPVRATYAHLGYISDPTYWVAGEGKRQLKIRDLPSPVVDAVKLEWTRIQDIERKAEAELAKLEEEEEEVDPKQPVKVYDNKTGWSVHVFDTSDDPST